MAARKQDSRQKMINMMYLVFIAMLALNISKEVLATLGILNEEIENSIKSKNEKSNELYRLFAQNTENPSYAFANEWAPVIKEATDQYYDFVQSLKDTLLLDETGKNKYKKSVVIKDGPNRNDTLLITNFQTMDKSIELDDMFFDGNNYDSLGLVYVDQFKNYSALMKSIIDSIVSKENRLSVKRTPHDFSISNDLISRSFTFKDSVVNSEGTIQPYLDYNFKGFPKIASLSKLTKLQSDIRELEFQMTQALTDKIKSDGSAVNINTSKTLFDSQPSYYVNQNINDAKIIVGRIDGNFRPDSVSLRIGNEKLRENIDYTIGGGAVNITKRFNTAGEKKIIGNLYFREANGSLSPIPVEQSLFINNRTDFFVELPKMDILYRGLPNLVRISDPEILASNLRVRSNGARTSAIGNSTWKVYPNSLNNTEIIITDASNPKIRKTKSFRVKDLPEMESAIFYNNNYFLGSDGISRRGLVRGKVTGEKPKDFDYDLKINVESFDFQVGSSPVRSVRGDELRELSALIETQTPGQVAFFTNIVSTAFSEGDREPIPNVKVRDFSIRLK